MKRLIHLWIAALIVLISIGETATQSASGETAVQPKRILFLHSYGQNFQPWLTWSSEVRRELQRQSPYQIDIQGQSLFTALTGDETATARFVEYLLALYASTPPDLIVAFGAPAARFVQQYRERLFPKTPMLLAGVNARRVSESLLSKRDAVVATQVEHSVLFEHIISLLPQTKTIAVIIGNSPGEQVWISELQQGLMPLLSDKIELRFYNHLRFDQLLKAVASLPPDSAIFFQQIMVDGAGAVYGDKEPLKRISEVANAPIFTFDQTHFDGGVVGGPMTSPTEGALLTAAVAVRMLKGEKPDEIHVPPIAFSAPKYDWRQLRRWNIDERRLPPGSEVVFREPTVWEQHSWKLSLVTAAVLLQAGLISILLHERNRRRTAEVQSRRRSAELAHVNRFSTAGELSALIAHEINQPLSAIMANAEAAQIILQSSSPDYAELREIVKGILQNNERASAVITRIRSLLKKAPFELKSFDLNDLTKETIEFLSPLAHGRKVELLSEIAPDPLPITGDHIQLQQVILNLVVNGMDAMKEMPSENRILSILTSRIQNVAELSVSDRGPGIADDKLEQVFDPFFTTKVEGMGMGLSIARTIVEAHNGLIDAKNRDRGGAQFRMRIPLSQ